MLLGDILLPQLRTITMTATHKPATKEKVDFNRLAADVLFGRGLGAQSDRLDYRKDKTANDVLAARKKGVAAGHGRTEFEIDMVAYYLSRVFKAHLKAPACNA